MNKKIFLVAIFFAGATILSAQITVDPNLDFYESAREWQVRGYVDFLPQMSPYPAAVVKNILDAVIEKGREADAEKAQYYYEKYFGKKWHVALDAGAQVKLSGGGEDWNKKFVYGEPSFFGDLDFLPWLTLGYDLGLNLHNNSTESREMLRAFRNDPLDTWGDAATFGSIDGNWDMIAGLALGNEKISGMLASNRMGFGNVFGHDSIILNPNSYHMANFLFNYAGEKVQYSQSISQIAASNFSGEHTANKFLAFHSIRFTPIKQLSISYYEAAIFGERFDPSYLIPAPFILLQGMFDAGDNDIYGLQFEYRPFDGFEAALSFAIDDISVDDWAKGDFDSKFKAALQTGVVYTPKSDFCNMISFDYTLVLPYMYSHWLNSPSKTDGVDETSYNYQNYTNRGICIGSSLPPNSDRFHFEIHFEPVKRLKLNVFTDFARHANETESWTDDEVKTHNTKFQGLDNSGGAETDPYPTSVQGRNTFMKQKHKMYIVQLGFDSSYEFFRNKAGALSLNFGYTFEYVHNAGVDTAIFKNVVAKGEEGNKKIETEDIAKARKDWAEKLHDEFNNYFSLSVKYVY